MNEEISEISITSSTPSNNNPVIPLDNDNPPISFNKIDPNEGEIDYFNN